MVAVNNNTISKEALLKNSKAENVAVPIEIGIIRTKKSGFAVVSIIIVLLLCTATLAVGFWLKSERQLPSFCCPCDQLKETSGTVRKGKSTCCINTESEYVETMKHMLNTPEPESQQEGSEDPKAAIAENEMKMLEAKNETITLLHSSPVAAHVLVACTNSSYYPYPQNQTSCKTVVPVEEQFHNIQPSQNSLGGRTSSTMVVPDTSTRPAREPGLVVNMAASSKVTIGDSGNKSRKGDRIVADKIGSITTEIAASAAPQSNPQNRIPQNACFTLGEGAVFEMGSRNNVEERGSVITANTIGTYSSKIG